MFDILQSLSALGGPAPSLPLTREEAQAVLEGLADAIRPLDDASGKPDGAAAARPDGRAATPPTAIQPFTADTLRRLLEAMPDALVVVDGDGRIVLVNPQTEKMFGYRRDELLGRPVEVLVPERYRDKHVEDRARYAAKPDPDPRPMGQRPQQLWGRRKDGSEVPVEISLHALHTDQGLLFVSAIRDISARLKHEARFRTLVEGIPAVTFMASLDGEAKELYVSPQLEKLLGFSQKEWLENPVLWYRQLHPDDRQRWHDEFAHTCDEGAPFRSVYRFISRDNRVVWVQGEAKLVRDKDGRPLFLQGMAYDMTAIKEAEAALLRAKEDLEERVRERTEELARSMAGLQEKTEELEQFAYVASHDLREPLRTLVNYPQRLLKEYGGQFDGRAAEWVNRTIDGARRMRELIDDLAQFSRVVRRDHTFQPVDTAAACAEAEANLQAAFAQSGAELTVGDLPTVQGNRDQLMLLFQNLVGNAVKYCAPDRRPRVAVGARREGDGWLFWVRDNGIGIEAKYLKKIFGLGKRLHSESKYPGTGFGLAICEKIVARHGGRIWAESELEQGSTFYFTLSDAAAADE